MDILRFYQLCKQQQKRCVQWRVCFFFPKHKITVLLIEHIQEKNLIHTESLNVLSNTRLAIDAFVWLKALFPHPEKYTSAMGGSPLTLTYVLSAELQKFQCVKFENSSMY